MGTPGAVIRMRGLLLCDLCVSVVQTRLHPVELLIRAIGVIRGSYRIFLACRSADHLSQLEL